MEYFDNHCHYDDEKFNEDREQLIKNVFDSGVTRMISAGYSLQGSKNSIAIARKYPFIYSTVGISPNDINENYKNELVEIEELLKNKTKEDKIVAIGEIGLDYHYDTPIDVQKEVFIKQIELANKYDLPIVIHTRDAVMDTLTILKEYPANKKGIFHCCPLNRELVKEGLKLGFYISFSGIVTFKNSHGEEIAKQVPDDRFLIETDAPYLSPEPVRGTRNDSRNLKYIVKKIAEFKDTSEEQIAKLSYENANKIYNIK